jgi:hypothetical protein
MFLISLKLGGIRYRVEMDLLALMRIKACFNGSGVKNFPTDGTS